MDGSFNCTWVKILIILTVGFISITFHLFSRSDLHMVREVLLAFRETANAIRIFQSVNTTNVTSGSDNFESMNQSINDSITLPLMTMTVVPTTLDAAELLVERPPSLSRPYQKNGNSTVVAFLFQTTYHILASLQMHLIRKFSKNLVAIELFTDGPATSEMIEVAKRHQAILSSFPQKLHDLDAGPSDRHTAVVNWALANKAKGYLANGSAIIMLDGDVLPLSPYDSGTLLNGHDVICRKHPALFARFCWIGMICISPDVHDTIDSFNVSQDLRGGKAYDSGGKTAEYFLNHPEISFAWMKETIITHTDKNLFWGALNEDIQWIRSNFNPCDKCGAEIIYSPFKDSSAVFYHMISSASNWRYDHQGPRIKALNDSIMQSPLGANQKYNQINMKASIAKIHRMPLIPFKGNFTCESICERLLSEST